MNKISVILCSLLIITLFSCNNVEKTRVSYSKKIKKDEKTTQPEKEKVIKENINTKKKSSENNVEKTVESKLNIESEQTKPSKPSNLLAELNFTDIFGKGVNLKQMRGKVIVFDFWASWCRPCIQQIPSLLQLYEHYKNQGVEFIGVSLDQTVDIAKKATKYFKLPWSQLYQDPYDKKSIINQINVIGIPYMIILDQNGNIAYKGHLSPRELQLLIEKLIKKERKNVKKQG